MNRPKLLLADDSVTIRKVVELTFADEGIEVSTVADANSAMQRFVEIQPDIVLIDVGLAGTNGYQICEMIKQDEATRHIPVLLLVGSFEPFDSEEASRVGADGFLTKPFQSIRDLVTRVWDLLGGPDSPTVGADEVTKIEFSPIPTPETDDIDNLYRSSFADTLEIEEFETVDDLFGDSQMDDEMIEASYPDPAVSDSFADLSPVTDKLGQSKEFDWSPESIVTGSTIDVLPKPAFGPKFILEDSTEDLAVDQVEIREPDEELDLLSDHEEISNIPSTDDHLMFDTSGALNPAVRETTPVDNDDTIETENIEEVRHVSDELIEIIAQRVVEKLSDAVVRDIAQVEVPRIAEKLIREALEEEGKS